MLISVLVFSKYTNVSNKFWGLMSPDIMRFVGDLGRCPEVRTRRKGARNSSRAEHLFIWQAELATNMTMGCTYDSASWMLSKCNNASQLADIGNPSRSIARQERKWTLRMRKGREITRCIHLIKQKQDISICANETNRTWLKQDRNSGNEFPQVTLCKYRNASKFHSI